MNCTESIQEETLMRQAELLSFVNWFSSRQLVEKFVKNISDKPDGTVMMTEK